MRTQGWPLYAVHIDSGTVYAVVGWEQHPGRDRDGEASAYRAPIGVAMGDDNGTPLPEDGAYTIGGRLIFAGDPGDLTEAVAEARRLREMRP